jgi:hypothetical protein
VLRALRSSRSHGHSWQRHRCANEQQKSRCVPVVWPQHEVSIMMQCVTCRARLEYQRNRLCLTQLLQCTSKIADVGAIYTRQIRQRTKSVGGFQDGMVHQAPQLSRMAKTRGIACPDLPGCDAEQILHLLSCLHALVISSLRQDEGAEGFVVRSSAVAHGRIRALADALCSLCTIPQVCRCRDSRKAILKHDHRLCLALVSRMSICCCRQEGTFARPSLPKRCVALSAQNMQAGDSAQGLNDYREDKAVASSNVECFQQQPQVRKQPSSELKRSKALQEQAAHNLHPLQEPTAPRSTFSHATTTPQLALRELPSSWQLLRSALAAHWRQCQDRDGKAGVTHFSSRTPLALLHACADMFAFCGFSASTNARHFLLAM